MGDSFPRLWVYNEYVAAKQNSFFQDFCDVDYDVYHIYIGEHLHPFQLEHDGLALLMLSSAEFEEIEKAGNIKQLSVDQRRGVAERAGALAYHRLLQKEQRSDIQVVSAPLALVELKLKTSEFIDFYENWRKTDAGELATNSYLLDAHLVCPDDAPSYFVTHPRPGFDIENIIGQLRSFRDAIAADVTCGEIAHKRGRPAHIDLNRIISTLADFYEWAGGYAAADSKRRSPFERFLLKINSYIPSPAKLSDEQLSASQIRRVLDRRRAQPHRGTDGGKRRK